MAVGVSVSSDSERLEESAKKCVKLGKAMNAHSTFYLRPRAESPEHEKNSLAPTCFGDTAGVRRNLLDGAGVNGSRQRDNIQSFLHDSFDEYFRGCVSAQPHRIPHACIEAQLSEP